METRNFLGAIYISILLSQLRFLQRFPEAQRIALPIEEVAVQRIKVGDSSSSVN